jgi:hypothetical protein
MKRLISLEAERHRQLSRIVWSGLSGGIGEEIVTSLDGGNAISFTGAIDPRKFRTFFVVGQGLAKRDKPGVETGLSTRRRFLLEIQVELNHENFDQISRLLQSPGSRNS